MKYLFIVAIFFYTFMFFLNNSIPSVFAQLNTDASILKELRENLDIEEIDVIYFHDRFDQEYEKAFQEYESGKHLESIAILEEYVDKVFLHEYKGWELLSENYKKLGREGEAELYGKISTLTKLILNNSNDEVFQLAFKNFESLVSRHSANPHFKVFVNYYNLRYKLPNFIEDDTNKDLISNKIIKFWKETSGDNFKKEDFTKYSQLIEEEDYLYKGFILYTLGSKYQNEEFLYESLKYEKKTIPRADFLKDTQHAAYYYIGTIGKDYKQSLYYFFKSYQIDKKILKDNKNSLIPLLFYSKVFQEEKIMLSLKSLIETDTYNFFYKLFLLSEVENYNMINEIIALYSQNKSVQKIEIEDLSGHIYDILLNKFGAETACSILSTKLNDISKQAFILYEPNLSACINIDIGRLNQELKKYNVSESSFFTNGVKKHSQIIGLLIFFFIIIFFIFVVFKKK